MSLFLSGRIVNGDIPDPSRVIPLELERAVTESMLLLERAVKLNTPIGVTEAARGSIGSELRRGFPLQRGFSVRAELGSPQRYIEVLERGRRPGGKQPPTNALELWVRRKLGIRDPTQARAVAFVIGRKIARRGTKPVRMFQLAAEQNLSKVHSIFERHGVNIEARITTGHG